MMFWDWLMLVLAVVVYFAVGMGWSISLEDEYTRHRRFIDAAALWWVFVLWPVAGVYYQYKINKIKRAFF